MRFITALLSIVSGVSLCTESYAATYYNSSLSLDLGEAKSNLNIQRLAYKRETHQLLRLGNTALPGYVETSFNRWYGAQQNTYALAISPVFVKTLCQHCRAKPYVEAGIGAALISRHKLRTRDGIRDMSSTFQFEDRIGVGIKTKQLNYHIRYMHYSNANLKRPNMGLDTIQAGIAFNF
jgi:lipid A 3-O-deacylase